MPLPWRFIRRPVPSWPEAWPPTATQILVAANAAGFLTQWLLAGGFQVIGTSATPSSSAVRTYGALSWEGLQAWRVWQPLSCLFLHESALSLVVSLALLYLAGRNLETIVGRRHLFSVYACGGLLGAGAQIGWHGLERGPGAVMGASSAVMAVFIAFACAMPELEVTPLLATSRTVRPRGVKVKHVAIGTGLAVAVLLVADPGGHMRGQTDLTGCMVGCLVGALYMRQLGFGRRTVRRREATQTEPEPAPDWSSQGSLNAASTPSAKGSPSSLTEVATVAATGGLVVPRFTERERRMTAREYIAEKIDPILDKILLHGLGSLTDEERRVLEKGREKIDPRQGRR